jgi:hypothetical protein
MIKTLTSVAAALLLAGTAHATAVTVDALADSYNSGTGTGAAAGTLTLGESFSVTAASTDLWSAGALPRWSDADGLTATTFATGTDESGQAAGTQIGQDFGLLTTSDGSFHYGELVGRIGSGAYFAIGTNFSGTANASGVLDLFYWDSYTPDNSGSIVADVTAVPEPGSVALILAGLCIIGGLARRRARKGS